jgi:anti-anti-sigma regulatory factor
MVVRGVPPPPGSATLHLSGDDLLDSSMLEHLCGMADRLEWTGGRLVVACDDEPVRRLLHVAGFSRRFDLVPGEPPVTGGLAA